MNAPQEVRSPTSRGPAVDSVYAPGDLAAAAARLGIAPEEDSPLAAALSADASASAATRDGPGPELEPALRALAAPARAVRVVRATPARIEELLFFAAAGDPTRLAASWKEEGGWRIVWPVSDEEIARLCDDAAHADLPGRMDGFPTLESAGALLALAGCIDALRFRDLAGALYRTAVPADPLEDEEIEKQVRLGGARLDARWAGGLLHALLPPGLLFPEEGAVPRGVAELAAAGLLESAGGGHAPRPPLLRLAGFWSPPAPAASIAVVDREGGRVTTKDGCAFVRGRGPLVAIDFGRAFAAGGGPAGGAVPTRACSGDEARERTRAILGERSRPGAEAAGSAAPGSAAAGSCTQCGGSLRPGLRFCTRCGAPAATRGG